MTIQLACCSDTHDQVPPVVDLAGVAAWLHAGDVYEGPDHNLEVDVELGDSLRKALALCRGAPLRQWIAAQTVPIYTVHGNHDGQDYWNLFDSLQHIDGRIVQLAEHLFLAGVGWHGEEYFDTPGESDLEPVCHNLLRQARHQVMPSDLLILLTHFPADLPGLFPFSGNPDGYAFNRVRALTEELSPIAVVQGHQHGWFGLAGRFKHSAGSTLVLNPGPRGMLLSVDLAKKAASCRPL